MGSSSSDTDILYEFIQSRTMIERVDAHLYGIDTDEMTRSSPDFAQLSGHINLPVRTYSSGMKSRLAFAMSMAIEFYTYLIDEVTAVGDGAFRAKCERSCASV